MWTGIDLSKEWSLTRGIGLFHYKGKRLGPLQGVWPWSPTKGIGLYPTRGIGLVLYKGCSLGPLQVVLPWSPTRGIALVPYKEYRFGPLQGV